MNPWLSGRRAGVLLHASSLPSGRLDADAWRWIDWLAEAGMSVWQMLPLGVPLSGVSPYQCASAFALNPALFPLELPAVRISSRQCVEWRERERAWIEDYALFMTIREKYRNAPWVTWPEPLRLRKADALREFAARHERAIARHVRQQYQLFVHWQALRSHAAERGVALFGDMPLFVAHDSADVWAHPECFLLDTRGQPTFVAGVPPDYFSPTGQRWGNPQYAWNHLESDHFSWWCERLRYHFECFDLVRIDHFRGLVASWMIPASHDTATEGYWQAVPGRELLQQIHDLMGDLPLVAEDLGVITPDVNALREQFGLPGMSVLQFAFDSFPDNPHKVENVDLDRVYYTGTHDNDTTAGWFDKLEAPVRADVMAALGVEQPGEVVAAMRMRVLSSRAALAMLPMQDVLGLDGHARMNTPGTVDGNWLWRFGWEQLPAGLAASLHAQLEQTGRLYHA